MCDLFERRQCLCACSRSFALGIAILLLGSMLPASAQTRTCQLEPIDSQWRLRGFSANEPWGDWRVFCTGFGAGPVEVNVFSDAPISNRTVLRNGHRLTHAVLVVEGTTPQTAVPHYPGDPFNPQANVFYLERRDDRIGDRLFADGLPANGVLILSGVQGDVEEIWDPNDIGSTVDLTVSMAEGQSGAFRQVPVQPVREDAVLATDWDPDEVSRYFGSFTAFVHSGVGLTGPVGPDVWSEYDDTDFYGATCELEAKKTVSFVNAIEIKDSGLDHVDFDGVDVAGQAGPGSGFLRPYVAQGRPEPRILRRIIDFDPATFTGGRPATEEDSALLVPDANGVVVSVFEIVGLAPRGPETFQISYALSCSAAIALSGTLKARGMLGPATPDQAARFLDFDNPAALRVPGVAQGADDLPLPAFQGAITETEFVLDERPCSPVLNTGVAAVLNAASFDEGALAPEMIVSVFGTGLAQQSEVATTTPLPTTLAGATMTVTDSDGMARDMELFFVSSTQVNGVIPAGTALGPATLTASTEPGEAAALRDAQGGEPGPHQGAGLAIEVAAIAPGLFAANAMGNGIAAAQALRVSATGEQTVEPLFDANLTPIALDLGETDQVYLLLYGTGIRGFFSAVLAKVGDEDVPVLGAVPQGQFIGLDQVNIGPLPRSLAGRGEVKMELTVDAVVTNFVSVVIL